MGTTYLLDTSACSKYFMGLLGEEKLELIDEVIESKSLLSIVSHIELMSWITESEEMDKVIADFITTSDVFQLTNDIVQKTIEIRRKVKIKLPDAIIAATAIVHNLTLLSTNDSDFVKVPKLKYKSLN
jgi:predicted nucleic acid-binding protein